MATLTDVRDRTRTDLSDLDCLRWSDDQLDRHIGHALDELSLAMPQELTASIATTPGSRELATDAIDGLIEVEAVEFPTGEFPPVLPGFSTWGGTLTVHSATVPDGAEAKLYYLAMQELDEDGSTLTAAQVDILVTGASAYAAQERGSATTEALNLDARAAERYAAWSRARLTAFRQLLHTYGRKNRLRGRRMYVPA
jgi:hypothetical protein